jgi:hypothetical protein
LQSKKLPVPLRRDFDQHGGKAGDKIDPVQIADEYVPAFDTAADDVVQGARSVYALLARHEKNISPVETYILMGVPLHSHVGSATSNKLTEQPQNA